MGLFDNIFRPRSEKRSSAALAKERLQIVVTHERAGHRGGHDYLPSLKKDLLDVVRKYVHIGQDQIKVHLDKEGDRDILELNITLPEEAKTRREDKVHSKDERSRP